MAVPERDTVYSSDDTTRTTYTRESSATGWFVGIIVALALLAIGYLVFSANSGPSTVNNTAIETTAPADTAPAPMTEAPATGTETTPMAPATEPAPVDAAPATDAPAPAVEAPPPATEAPAAQ